jgi:DNA-binding GntR family transcriptional regulator
VAHDVNAHPIFLAHMERGPIKQHPGQMSDWSLEGLRRVSTTEQATQVLRDAIVSGRIPQGESLREVQVAEMLGTGRSAVREAIRQLVQEGLVEHELHRGARVRLLGEDDVRDIYAAREAIEPYAAELLVQRDPPCDSAALAKTVRELERVAQGKDKPPDRLIELDIEFHQQFVDLAGSRRLSRAHATLVAEARMVLHHHPALPLPDYASQHRALLTALEQRNPQLPLMMRRHLIDSATVLLETVGGTDGAGSG